MTETLHASCKETYGVSREILPLRFLYPIISVQHYIDTNLHGNYRERIASTVNSIRENGMIHPLVVWKTTTDQWEQLIQISNKSDLTVFTSAPDVPETVHVVMCGCRRLYAAQQLGYSSVDCLVADSIKNTSKICPQQRKAFKKLDI